VRARRKKTPWRTDQTLWPLTGAGLWERIMYQYVSILLFSLLTFGNRSRNFFCGTLHLRLLRHFAQRHLVTLTFHISTFQHPPVTLTFHTSTFQHPPVTLTFHISTFQHPPVTLTFHISISQYNSTSSRASRTHCSAFPITEVCCAVNREGAPST
jgi:hypothetical protein